MSALPEDQLLRLQAVTTMQIADVSSLLSLLSEIRAALVESLPQLQEHMPEVGERFLQLRKQFLHAQLEKLEERDPALAARIQQQIDSAAMQYPFDYDEI